MNTQRLLVGLGNPGPQYSGTRHNAGFDTIDLFLDLAEKTGRVRELSGTKFLCMLWQVTIPELPGTWICAKPMTFMNESGRSVQPLLAWYKLDSRSLVVIHDELDLSPGSLRFKFSGGNAGHNGLKSISQRLGTNDFYRLRIGIGRPPAKDQVIPWVLGRACGEDGERIRLAQQKGLEVLTDFAVDGLEAAVAKARAF
ncbi:MAG: aminoacyl-tRNA hydrolase [Desulfovibrio sp.]|nr:aminoacyl-tRNA hydrolase [Desulfovibrio sp.]